MPYFSAFLSAGLARLAKAVLVDMPATVAMAVRLNCRLFMLLSPEKRNRLYNY